MQTIRRTIHPETRVLDGRKAICEYVASDETVDGYREVIRANGWLFSYFEKNAPFVDSHDYRSIEKCLGKVIDFAVRGKRLVETVQWAIDVPENRLAQFGWKMTAAGFLKAVSVGFRPVRTLRAGDSGWNAELAKLGVDGSANISLIYLEQEQLELSAVLLGANPNALVNMAKAYKAGALNDNDVEFFSAQENRRRRRARWFEGKRRGRAQEAFLRELNEAAHQVSTESFLMAFERALRRT